MRSEEFQIAMAAVRPLTPGTPPLQEVLSGASPLHVYTVESSGSSSRVLMSRGEAGFDGRGVTGCRADRWRGVWQSRTAEGAETLRFGRLQAIAPGVAQGGAIPAAAAAFCYREMQFRELACADATKRSSASRSAMMEVAVTFLVWTGRPDLRRGVCSTMGFQLFSGTVMPLFNPHAKRHGEVTSGCNYPLVTCVT
jgi:hypothetical protein